MFLTLYIIMYVSNNYAQKKLVKIYSFVMLYNHHITCEIAIKIASIHDAKSLMSMLGNT